MAHNIEYNQNKQSYSFAERLTDPRQKAWHGLGQTFDRPMFVAEALQACNADYTVKMQPVFALTDELQAAMASGAMIKADEILKSLVKGTTATIRTDNNSVLGVVSDKYGIVQNADAFRFVDMFCSGKFADRDNTPVIETCGVLGKGERVFVSAKFPQSIILNAGRNDLIDIYVVFTTSHDGSGAVKCLVTPVRVVCNNTLNFAMSNNIGRLSFRHTSNVMSRIDLLNKENAEFAYKALNLAEVYTNGLQAELNHLRNIKLSEKQLDDILASVLLPTEGNKAFAETRNIFDERISTRARNIFMNVKESCENGIGQDLIESGSGLWVVNGLTTYYQNHANQKDNEIMFDSVMQGDIYRKLNAVHDKVLQLEIA